MEMRNQYILAEDWMIVVLILGSAILAWVRYGFPKRLPRLINSIISHRSMKQMMREESLFSHRASQGLALLFLLSAALFLFLLSVSFDFYPLNLQGITLYVIYFGVLFFTYMVKIIANRLIIFLMEENYGLEDYLFNVAIINMGIGILLLPVVILIAYLPVEYATFIAKTSAYFVLIVFIYRVIRGAIIALEAKANYIYIILYLCGLEILPIALCAKWLIA